MFVFHSEGHVRSFLSAWISPPIVFLLYREIGREINQADIIWMENGRNFWSISTYFIFKTYMHGILRIFFSSCNMQAFCRRHLGNFESRGFQKFLKEILRCVSHWLNKQCISGLVQFQLGTFKILKILKMINFKTFKSEYQYFWHPPCSWLPVPFLSRCQLIIFTMFLFS